MYLIEKNNYFNWKINKYISILLGIYFSTWIKTVILYTNRYQNKNYTGLLLQLLHTYCNNNILDTC